LFNLTLLMLLSGAAASVSLLSAVLKARAIRKESKKVVTITMGDQTFDIEASESDVRSAVEKLQRRSVALR
jgi:hypothetical protein